MISCVSIANSAERRPEAASQKCSIAPVMRRRISVVNLVGWEKSSVRMRPGLGASISKVRPAASSGPAASAVLAALPAPAVLPEGARFFLGASFLVASALPFGLTVASLSALARGDLDGGGIASVAGRGCRLAGARAAGTGGARDVVALE